jgi:uncharacterized protein YhjY with autotransporter beta-barrel domain
MRLRSRLVLGCSAFAVFSICSPALADCAPDPTVAYAATICSGIDSNGLAVPTIGTQVQVQAGAIVQPGTNPASIAVSNSATISVDGTLDGGSVDGLLVTNGAPHQTYVPYDPYAGASPNYNAATGYLTIYPSSNAYLTVGSAGIVTGSTAIRLKQRPDNTSGLTNLSIQNSGAISGTGGTAIVAESGTAIGNIDNVQGGTIGAISGLVGSIGNGGAIDGGNVSAVNSSGSNYVTNTGTIVSSNSIATLSLGDGTVDNYGSITNTGSGAVIISSGPLSVYNHGSGSISANGGTAISTASQLYIRNQGIISGSIDAHMATAGATIDTSGGTIEGDILFGSGDDLLLGGLLDIETGSFSNISGNVDGGSGLDTVNFALATDGTLDAIALPINFEKMQLTLANEAAVTLGQGLDLDNGITVGGSGSIINDRDITSTGSAISTHYVYPSALNISNSGNINSTLANNTEFALNLGTVTSVDNSGSITATGGGGVSAHARIYGATVFTNTGTIIADDTGTLISGKLDNQGTIQSTGGVGVVNSLGGGVVRGITSTNSGTIEGVTAGLQVDTINFANTGTITATNGIGVDLQYYPGFDNQAGGTVSGTTAAIGFSSFGYNALIQNAGTLNGDVNLVPQGSGAYDFSDDIFIDNGGTVNGDLLLGGGNDLLITDLSRGGQLAGVTSTVDAGSGYDVIRHRVGADTSSTISVPASFEGLGYDLANDAALTLTGSGSQSLSLTFSGQGSVDLDADLSQTDHILVDLGALNVAQLTGIGTSTPSDLSLVSRGTLSLTTSTNYYYGAVAVNGGGGKFENTGTITVASAPGGYYLPSAISNASEATNSGTITLDGAIASSNVGKFTNTGSITQISGGASSQGVVANQIDNSGTISVDGIAVTAGYNYGQLAVSNSGLIESKQNIGILASGGTITNADGATISGQTIAIQNDQGGTVVNAGTINGDVLIGNPYYYFSGQGKYVADGGTLNGNLTFGSANDILLTLDGVTEVTGTIDAGSGTDLFGRFYRADATTQIGGTLPVTFEGELVESIGSSTIVTLTDPGSTVSSNLSVAGDGQIVNQTTIGGRVTALADGSVASDGVGVLASFTNDGDLAGGFDGVIKSFANTGIIGSAALTNIAVDITNNGDIDFDNSGTVTAGSGWTAVNLRLVDADHFSFANSGTISGHVSVQEGYSFTGDGFQSGTITNSGLISTNVQPALSMVVNTHNAPGNLGITNSGTLQTSEAGGSALRLDMNYGAGELPSVAIDNSGTIQASSAGFGPVVVPLFLSYASTPSAAILLTGNDTGTPLTITNRADGLISANHYNSAAILAYQPAVILDNAGTILGSAGTSWTKTLYSNTGYRVDLDYHLAGAIQTGYLDDVVRNIGTITGSIDLGGGNDTIENKGTLSGDIFLNDGDDRFVEGLSASFTGTGDGGNGNDTLIFDITGGGTLDVSLYDQFINFENFGLTGQGTISAQGTLPMQTLILDGATFDLAQGSTLQTLGPVAITGTGSNDHVINHGTIIGDVVLGDGNDQFDAYPGSSVSGTVDGGGGVNGLRLYFDNAATAPTPIDLSPYSGFEQFTFGSGIGSLSGSATFNQIDVAGGRLIGLAGSTINAPQGINVAPDATFGSAGTVNGNISIGGTLSPGASPGTMTINGDVTLVGGSTTLFEMTPAVSDALVISGGLTIQSGATLDITGSRPLTPGVTYDLITAGNGINGSFSTISKATSVLGFIRQTANAVQLLGTLQLLNGASRQVLATTNHINSLLANGTATPGIYAALPSLVDAGGYADPSVLSTLHPEAYASASQIGIDNGLALSSAARSSSDLGNNGRQGLFGLGQGFGAWHRLNSNPTTGVSRANVNTGGFLGGIGFASDNIVATAFVGRIYADQSFGTLAAETKTEGTFIGGSLAFSGTGLVAGGSIIWDDSSADTRRTLYDGSKATGHYNLRSLTLDGHIGYRFNLRKGGWQVGPRMGVTHVAVKRGGLFESGAGAFSLDVARRTTKATFFDADLELTMAGDTALRPWLSAGWQHRIDGDPILATASFTGTSSQFTTSGTERARDFVRVGAGVDWRMTPSLDLFAKANSAFGPGRGINNITIGLRLGF